MVRLVRTAQSVTKLQAGCSMASFLAGARDFFSPCPKQPGCGAPVGTRGFFPGVKWLGHDADHLPQSTADFKNGGAIRLLPLCAFLV